eukprot:scaffold4582_cov166-Amphora_coffeaeformis.AAC.2
MFVTQLGNLDSTVPHRSAFLLAIPRASMVRVVLFVYESNDPWALGGVVGGLCSCPLDRGIFDFELNRWLGRWIFVYLGYHTVVSRAAMEELLEGT